MIYSNIDDLTVCFHMVELFSNLLIVDYFRVDELRITTIIWNCQLQVVNDKESEADKLFTWATISFRLLTLFFSNMFKIVPF